MSTGAGMLFLFRVKHLLMAFYHSPTSSLLPLLHCTECLRSPQRRRPDPDPDTQTQEEPRAASGRGQEAPFPRLSPPAVFVLISVPLAGDNEKVSSGHGGFLTFQETRHGDILYSAKSILKELKAV